MKIENLPDGIKFQVKVQPKSSKNEVTGKQGSFLKVKLTEAPVKGKANKQLIKILAKCLEVKKGDIEIVRGKISPVKVVKIKGTAQFLINKLKLLISEKP